MAEYTNLSEPNPEFQDAVSKLPPSKPAFTEVLAECRDNYLKIVIPLCHAMFEGYMPPESAYKVTDRHIDVGGGTQVLARCVVPTPKPGEDGKYPLVFWMHGGGWTIGDVNWDDHKCRKLAVDKRVSVVNVEYRLAPEHPFPAAPNDCLAALKYVAQNEGAFSADLSKGFIIGGMSAGGNLTAVTTHQYLDDPLSKSKPLTGQILVVPATINPKAYPDNYKGQLLSYEQNKEAPSLSSAVMTAFYNWYKGNPTDPRQSPLLYGDEKFKALPPTFLQICGWDPLRDEGLLYEKKIKGNGVKTKLEVYPGVPHGFEVAVPTTKVARKFLNDFEEGVQWLLNGAV